MLISLFLVCFTIVNSEYTPNYAKREILKTFNGEVRQIIPIANNAIALTGSDNSLRIFNYSNLHFRPTRSFVDHSDKITDLKIFKNGDFVTSSLDKTLFDYRLNTNDTHIKILQDTSEIYSFAELENGLILTGSKEQLKVFELNKTQSIDTGDYSVFSTLEIENFLITASSSNFINVYDKNSDFSLIKSLSGHTSAVWRLIKLSNGLFASCSSDNKIKIWNPKDNFSIVSRLEGHGSAVYALLELDNGLILSGSYDTTIKVWDLSINPPANTKTLTGHKGAIKELVKLQGGLIASASEDNTINIWNPNDDFKLIKTIDVGIKAKALVVLSNGLFVSGGNDGTIYVRDPKKDFEAIQIISTSTYSINSLYQIENELLLSGSDDGVIRFWKFDKASNTLNLVDTKKPAYSKSNYHINQLSDRRIVSSFFNRVEIWPFEYSLKNTFNSNKDVITSIVELKNGIIATSSNDMTINFYDNNLSLLKTLTLPAKVNRIIELNNNLISILDDGSLKIFDLNDYSNSISQKICNSKSITAISESLIAIGCEVEKKVIIFDIVKNQITPIENLCRVTSLASFNQKYLTIGCSDGALSIYYDQNEPKEILSIFLSNKGDSSFRISDIIPDLKFRDIMFIQASNCGGNVIYNYMPVQLLKVRYSIYDKLIYNKGECKETFDQIVFTTINEGQDVKTYVVNVQLNDAPYFKKEVYFVGQFGQQLQMDFSGMIEDKNTSIDLIKINFPELPTKGVLKDKKDKEVSSYGEYPAQTIFIYSLPETEATKDQIIDNFTIQAKNKNNVTSEVVVGTIRIDKESNSQGGLGFFGILGILIAVGLVITGIYFGYKKLRENGYLRQFRNSLI